MVKGQYARFVHGHNRRKQENEMYSVCPLTGCWLWLLGTSGGRYGMIDSRPAHCVMYEKYKGKIPDGLQLDHKCRVTLCVNPEHLEPVTGTVNVQRGALAKLSETDVIEIRAKFNMNVSQEALSIEYRVTESNIYMIVTGRSWRNIPMAGGKSE